MNDKQHPAPAAQPAQQSLGSVPNDPACTCGSDSARAYHHKGNCPHSIPWNDRVQARLAAAHLSAVPKG